MADVKQILVVDDHFEMLEFMRTVLQHSGRDYQVLAVPSAEEGMLELLRTPFDLLITDVRLPGMSGFDLIRRVRRARPELPVIMISGYGIEQGQKEAAALGVVHYFVKPLDSDLLLLTVQRTLFGEPVGRTTRAGANTCACRSSLMPSASSTVSVDCYH
ncbi:MAG: response regulator [Chloroflexi bacterium]|nr:response regulator [Chloroflexota bacterium]